MSDDRTREIVTGLIDQYPHLSLIDNALQLTPYAFNLGVHASLPSDYVQIIGARHIVSSNYLSSCLEILKADPTIWCVGGRIINEYTNAISEVVSKAMSTTFGMGLGNFRTLQKSAFTDTVTSPMYPAWVFEKIGLFDEELVRNQDDDFNFRVIQAGGRIYYEHEISLKYYVRATFSGLWRQFFQYGYWKVYVNKKHKSVTTLRQLVPPIFVLYVLLLPFVWILSAWIGVISSSPFILYLLLNIYYSVRSSKNISEFPQLMKTYWILHLSYGLGYLIGLWEFLLLGRQPSYMQKRLSR